MDVRATNEIVPLWTEVLFVLTKVIDGPLKGEKYQLTNTSAESHGDRRARALPASGGGHFAVGKPQLAPGEQRMSL
jgi:conjugal transfer pilus assembly protein TraK